MTPSTRIKQIAEEIRCERIKLDDYIGPGWVYTASITAEATVRYLDEEAEK